MRAEPGGTTTRLRYFWDRRPDPRLVELASPGGALAPLVAYARRSPHPVTVDFWADRPAHLQRIIVHVGVRRVVEITWQPHRLRIDAARVVRDPDPSVPLATWLPSQAAPRVADIAVRLLDATAPALSVGSAVAAAGVLASGKYALAASPFLGTFPAASRREVLAAVSADVVAAVARADVPGFIPAMKPAADALLVDRHGGLVVLEAEASRAAEVAYAPAQIVVCLRLLRLWAGTATAVRPELRMPDDVATVLDDVLDARRRSDAWFGEPVRLDPAAPSAALIAIEPGLSPRLEARLRAVWQALVDAGIPEASEIHAAEFGAERKERDLRL